MHDLRLYECCSFRDSFNNFLRYARILHQAKYWPISTQWSASGLHFSFKIKLWIYLCLGVLLSSCGNQVTFTHEVTRTEALSQTCTYTPSPSVTVTPIDPTLTPSATLTLTATTTNTPTETSTPKPGKNWYGMWVPYYEWTTWENPNAIFDPLDPRRVTGPVQVYAVLTSIQDPSCNVRIYGDYFDYSWDGLTYEEYKIHGVNFLLSAKIGRDDSQTVRHAFYFFYRKSSPSESFRSLGHFVIDAKQDWESCIERAESLFQTIDPYLYPRIPVFQ